MTRANRAAAAIAAVRRARLEQTLGGRGIRIETRALIKHLSVPFEPERLERAEDVGCGTRYFPGRIDVFDSYEPLPTGLAGMEVARNCRQQRA
jgi:hypothetical protein